MAGYCCFDPQSVWYRVSQKKLGSSVYANISSLSSHFEITKDSFKICTQLKGEYWSLGLGDSWYTCDQFHMKNGPNQTFLFELLGFEVGRGGDNATPRVK